MHKSQNCTHYDDSPCRWDKNGRIILIIFFLCCCFFFENRVYPFKSSRLLPWMVWFGIDCKYLSFGLARISLYLAGICIYHWYDRICYKSDSNFDGLYNGFRVENWVFTTVYLQIIYNFVKFDQKKYMTLLSGVGNSTCIFGVDFYWQFSVIPLGRT